MARWKLRRLKLTASAPPVQRPAPTLQFATPSGTVCEMLPRLVYEAGLAVVDRLHQPRPARRMPCMGLILKFATSFNSSIHLPDMGGRLDRLTTKAWARANALARPTLNLSLQAPAELRPD